MSPTLAFRIASITILIAIWIFSFLPISGMPNMPGNDKWHHGLAYFACMFCWGQWFMCAAPRLKLALILMLMGALIECLQGLTSYRSFEWLDMVANAAGVALAWLVVTVQLAFQRRFASDNQPPFLP
ncbi:MAG: VanZ family protein [Burkholderiales bacterium]|nr:VanZ family protein [Burkholderiales bacterium]